MGYLLKIVSLNFDMHVYLRASPVVDSLSDVEPLNRPITTGVNDSSEEREGTDSSA